MTNPQSNKPELDQALAAIRAMKTDLRQIEFGTLHDTLGGSSFECRSLLRKLVEAGHLTTRRIETDDGKRQIRIWSVFEPAKTNPVTKTKKD